MNRHEYWIDFVDVSLAANTAKTLGSIITGTTRAAFLKLVQLSGASVTATDPPFKIELRERSTSGTSSAFTPRSANALLPAAICTARTIFTAEGTDVGLVGPSPLRLTPIGGLFVYDYGDFVMPISKQYAVVDTSTVALTNICGGICVGE